MLNITYIEILFTEFVQLVDRGLVRLQPHDRNATYSFYTAIINNDRITKNQANYILRILTKYRLSAKDYLDYEHLLENPIWKNEFRVIDKSLKVWVEKNSGELPWICLKFPYEIKESFELEFNSVGGVNVWDRERKLRKLSLYDTNIMQVYEFVKQHNFEIDQSFLDALATVEQIWESQENIIPQCYIDGEELTLMNAPEEAIKYFDENKNKSLKNNLILAKNMGYVLNKNPTTTYEKIAAANTNIFWMKSIDEFLSFSYDIEGPIAVILDRSSEAITWCEELDRVIKEKNYNPKDFRICFREKTKDDANFNNWVSENGYGGKIEGAKYLIFKQKPAKWLFKDKKYATIVATNNLYPSTDHSTKSMLQHHPCVVYVGEVMPVKQKEDYIVEL